MRRPNSPSPRRSQDNRPVSPQPVPTLRRSSSDVSHPRKRLLANLKLKNAGNTSPSSNASTASTTNSNTPPTNQPSPSHSRTASNSAPSPTGASPSTNTVAPKASSPSKNARDMHRLGPMPTQGALTPAISAAASASSLSLASNAVLTNNVTSPGTSTTDPWHMLHVHVLPLFNGEALRMPIESLNQLVQRHISAVVSRSVSRAISTLEQDVNALLANGMLTINVKLSELEDDKFLSRVIEIWEFFWYQVLPYVEGVFHPLQTDKLIRTLSRTPKTHRAPSPTLPEEPLLAASTQSIDVRTLTLRSFRDSVVLPIYPRLHTLLTSPRKEKDKTLETTYSQPRLQQMLLVLVSTAHHPKPLTESPPSQGEGAVAHLLRDIRDPQGAASAQPYNASRISSFFAGSAPRDRRGRVARKSARYTALNLTAASAFTEGEEWPDDETPRNIGFRDERDRERAILESLRSPELDPEEAGGVEGGAGGWGLGRGQEHGEDEEEDEDDGLDWVQAQTLVERMVGLRG